MARRGHGVDYRKMEAERALAVKEAHMQEEEWLIADLLRGEASPRCVICGAPLTHSLLRHCAWCGAERRGDHDNPHAAGALPPCAGGDQGASPPD